MVGEKLKCIDLMPPRCARVAVLFSGGKDSTLAAIRLLENDCEIHLLTMVHDAMKWESQIEHVQARVEELRKNFPESNITWKRINCTYYFKKIGVECLEEDVKKYNMMILICMACKVAMHYSAIHYCVRNGIRYLADGSNNGEGCRWMEWSEEVLREFCSFSKKYGIMYCCPVYNSIGSKKNVKDILTRYGIYTKSLELECIMHGIAPSLEQKAGKEPLASEEIKHIARYVRDKFKLLEELDPIPYYYLGKAIERPHDEIKRKPGILVE